MSTCVNDINCVCASDINYLWFFLTQLAALAIALITYCLISIYQKRNNNSIMKRRFIQTLNKLKLDLKGLQDGLKSAEGRHDFGRYLNLTFWESAVGSGLILQYDEDDLFFELHDVFNISKVIDDRLKIYYELSVKSEDTKILEIYINWSIAEALPKIEKVLEHLK